MLPSNPVASRLTIGYPLKSGPTSKSGLASLMTLSLGDQDLHDGVCHPYLVHTRLLPSSSASPKLGFIYRLMRPVYLQRHILTAMSIRYLCSTTVSAARVARASMITGVSLSVLLDYFVINGSSEVSQVLCCPTD